MLKKSGILIATALLFSLLVGCGGSGNVRTQESSSNKQSSSESSVTSVSSVQSSEKQSSEEKETGSITLLHGKLVSANNTNDTDYDDRNMLIIKAKIEPSYSNRATIIQNYFNVADIIKNQGGNTFDTIDYWAVADMTDGSEAKVISFTVNKDTIDLVYRGKIADNQLGDYADDLWILQSLK